MGFSSVLKKVRYAVLFVSHTGTPVLKDILKMLTRIFRGGKECLQLQAWQHTQFLEKGKYAEGTIKKKMV